MTDLNITPLDAQTVYSGLVSDLSDFFQERKFEEMSQIFRNNQDYVGALISNILTSS